MSYKVGQKDNFKPFNLVIFGGTGDLAFRKIYPALYNRFINGESTVEFSIMVVHRKEMKETFFHDSLSSALKESTAEFYDEDKYKEFLKHFVLIRIANHSLGGYNLLAKEINKNNNRHSIYYYSTPSNVFGEISSLLKDLNLINENSKVVVEKPLGHDLASSIEINNTILSAFKESQIYRIDHYLGKETVQNLMVLRFANNLFERAWNSENIDNVQITVAESLGVEARAGYYDKSGALRDMVQNHILQLLCLVAMEPPVSLDANNVRDEKLKVLKALRLLTSESIITDTVKGQYTRGRINKSEVNSYLEDLGKYDSGTETFVAIKAFVDNWRWKNVPFYLRTGKRMAKRYSDIVINFKPVKHDIFPAKEKMPGNQLIIRLQPEERIELVQMTKIPGPGGYRYKPISLKLDYMDSFNERFPEAYERLIIDVIRGNQTLFMRHDELSAAWKWTESIFRSWQATQMKNELYMAGSWGPGSKLMDKNTDWFNDASIK
ncbi:glucose-6-phosphate dehydrogenase [Bacteroidia bacterium]|nr:glucose-6-phosphate dehydrogenase [Bacteroidia bacterium]